MKAPTFISCHVHPADLKYGPKFVTLAIKLYDVSSSLGNKTVAGSGLVFPALVLGYKSFNCSMYQVPVPTLIEKFV